MNNYEVFTMTDKKKRDELFEDFRKDGSPQERRAVKFSSNEPTGEVREVQYWLTGSKHPQVQLRPVYRSTWTVAYPREIQ
jgi:hypothetical protein